MADRWPDEYDAEGKKKPRRSVVAWDFKKEDWGVD